MSSVRNRLWRVFHRDPLERWLRGNFDTWFDACEDLDTHYVEAVRFIWEVMDTASKVGQVHNCNNCVSCRARYWLAENGWSPNMAGVTGPSHIPRESE